MDKQHINQYIIIMLIIIDIQNSFKNYTSRERERERERERGEAENEREKGVETDRQTERELSLIHI